MARGERDIFAQIRLLVEDSYVKVTICELPNDEPSLRRAWDQLAEHVRHAGSDLVVLPEMPFAPWFAVAQTYDEGVWRSAVEQHERWLERLPDLGSATVIGTRPVTRGSRHVNEAFAWDAESGYRPLHDKRYLPDEEGFWEAHWYAPGDGDFTPARLAATPAGILVGVLICTEMWSMTHAQRYGKAGVHLIATPRCTGRATVDKWVTGGRAVAIVSGAYSVSSNRNAPPGSGDFGGGGWVIDPDGQVLALTTNDNPICTVEIDLTAADAAKRTYPRYALD
jgi:N-carbamoylputrescine amidase